MDVPLFMFHPVVRRAIVARQQDNASYIVSVTYCVCVCVCVCVFLASQVNCSTEVIPVGVVCCQRLVSSML